MVWPKGKAKAKAKPQAKKREASEVNMEVENPCNATGLSPNKRPRTAPRIPGVDLILKILSDDRLQLPEGNCREMLLHMAPRALCTPHDDRHEMQTTAVQILDEALQSIGEQVRTQTTVAQEKATAASQDLAELEAKVVKGQEALDAQVAEIATHKQSLDAAATSVCEADAELVKAKNAQKQVDSACAATLAEKEACLEILEGSYKSLKESKWGNDFAKLREQVDEVVNFMKSVKTVAVPSSLIYIEGPSVLRSKKESRGAHAEQIFADIEAIFSKHLAAVEDRLNAENLKSEEVLPQTKAAEEAAQQALQAKDHCSSTLAAAEARKAELQVELQQHKDSVTAQHEVVATTAATTEKIMSDQAEIEQAFSKCMSAFKILRDQSPDTFATLSDIPSPGRSTPPPVAQEA
eukprot:gnl/MRDRNA2_/MRDRNA2_88746_c0_seq1.p1 gnl/MRDRNA2_/MRDRNA2_88746_c0~~gnl/MRDRNA2_/MRDRNA2_88746_c0_seq1.p1  ORF type:complete len:408 (+),score=142.06 gnl/MRDRNA2_/MRDRNA2_88746_c0_seq1:83-1306(+)